MAQIIILPEDLVTKIAAGEVVERPASVVKELAENALDARARHVRIDVEEGGRKTILVLDDGVGIPKGQLPLACLSHATSKIGSLDDLASVSTLGFRGEALCSIGAVSEMRILSRTREAAEGAEIIVRGGRMEPPRPAAAPPGTLVEVRDLFYNVPARAKFLRRASTEFRAISDVVTALAVARPDVGIDFRHDGKRVLNLPPVKEASARIRGLLGANIRKGLRPVEGSAEGLRLTGYVSSPEESRADTRSQYLIVRGRPIRDRTVLHAIREAYHTYLMKGRHAIAFLYLEPGSGEVDVNVHPAKAEARFRDPAALHTLVVESVRTAIESEAAPRPLRIPAPPHREVAETPPLWTGPPRQGEPREGMRPAPSPPSGRRFIQVHSTFLVEEVEGGVRIVDQHALHERILLHRLRKEMREGEVESQGALIPPTFPLLPGEKEVALDRVEDLRRLGYHLEEFGENDVLLRSFPALLDGADHAEVIRDCVARLEGKRAGPPDEEVLDDIVREMACRGAVKAGDHLRDDEIEELLDQEKEVTGSFACAHGRPTSLILTIADLERQFGRK